MDIILATVQDDLGGRGIRHLLEPQRDVRSLHDAATGLLQLPSGSHVAILTGFPCVQHATPPTETDGIAGTFALVHSLQSRGCIVHILTDNVNASVFQACIDRWSVLTLAGQDRLLLHSYPSGPVEPQALASMAALIEYWIAIERPGVHEANYYTMRARAISEHVAHLDAFFQLAQQRGVPTLAIGDGGNELGVDAKLIQTPIALTLQRLGLGNVAPLTQLHIPHGEVIAAAQGCDHLILASISDWGGYAVCAAMTYLDPSVSMVLPQTLATLAATMVAAGARDGILGIADAFVDGWPLVVSLNRLHQLRHLCCRRHSRIMACQPGPPTLLTEWPRLGVRFQPTARASSNFSTLIHVVSKLTDVPPHAAVVALEVEPIAALPAPGVDCVALVPAALLASSDSLTAVRVWQSPHTRLAVVGGCLQQLQDIVASGIVVVIHVLAENTDSSATTTWCQQQRIGIWVNAPAGATTTASDLLAQPSIDAVLCANEAQLHLLEDSMDAAVVTPWSSI